MFPSTYDSSGFERLFFRSGTVTCCFRASLDLLCFGSDRGSVVVSNFLKTAQILLLESLFFSGSGVPVSAFILPDSVLYELRFSNIEFALV